MDTNAVYQRAWARLLERIESKTSWGRNALKDVMLDCLVNATLTFLVPCEEDPCPYHYCYTHNPAPDGYYAKQDREGDTNAPQ